MKKLVVTLDPEYIPWEPGTPTVRLRRKRNKTLLALMSVGVAVLGCVGLAVFGAIGKQRAATPAPSSSATIGATQAAPPPTPPLLAAGRPGHLAIVRGLTVTFYPCAAYTVRAVGAADTIAMGDTRAGAVVDITEKGHVEIQCDNTIFEF